MAPIGGHRVKRNTVSLLASCPVLTCRTVSLEQLVQQPGVGLDRANPVARHGDHLALQDTCTQLHFVGLDAMRSGEPPKDAEPDGHPSAATDHSRVAGRRPQHDRTDQQRKLPQHSCTGALTAFAG